MNQENCEITDISSSRFRRLHLLLGRDTIISSGITDNACFECVAWNQNANADECFVPRDLIVLTGTYHADGHENKSISVALQIKSIYVEGQKVSGLSKSMKHRHYHRSTQPCIKATKETKLAKSRHFVYVGDRNTEVKREESQ
ncbi:MAG: hypothetical protein IJ060_02045 [Oscillospiraceae bacterium]|nr:hypothetical protein [Oscillospiraceae bacterium]